MIRAIKINDPLLCDDGILRNNTYARMEDPIKLTVDDMNDFHVSSELKFYKSEADYARGDNRVFSTRVHAFIPVSVISEQNPYDCLYMSFIEGEYFQTEILYN